MIKYMQMGTIYSLFLFSWSMLMLFLFMFMSLNNCCYFMSWEMLNCMSMSIEFDMIFDWISCSFSSLVCLISGCVSIFSNSYMKGDMKMKRFMMILMLFVLSMNFLIFIPSLISLILGWDGLGLVSFILVIYYQNSKSLSAGMLTVLMNRIGDCFILMSVSMMVSLGHWNLLCLWNFKMLGLVMIFLVIAGMTKSAQIPFSSWLPAAMAAPTPVSALVHSSTLVTAGVFLIIRFYPFLLKFDELMVFMMYIAIMTTIMSGICAIYENDMKKIIALSTLSQLGVMMFSLSLMMPMLALFHLYTHAMFKALLFVCGGNIIYCYGGNQDIRLISGVSKLLPFTSLCLNIANMALCGFPFLAGFYSKDMIIEKMLYGNMNMFMVMLMLVGIFLTLFYSMRLSINMIWSGEVKSSYSCIKDNDMNMIIPMIVLVMGALFSGFMFQQIFMQFSEEIFLPSFYKMLIMIIIIISLIISLSMWNNMMNFKNYNFLNHFNMKMWFMSSLVSYPMLYMMKGMSNNNLKLIDMGWFEEIGGQGLFKLNKLLFKMMEHWMIMLINMYMIIMVMYMIFI
uniref:NADH-ubiquinone oxidoreductase chain 5 n=1 Tax=Luteuthis dentatus TaxID=167155 RepID=A0A9E9FWI7_9MOLL|nr:NADH dehydrogenase subunit 5 [Luteuthis dentatus]WAP91468.1 NADH dehydrogenase subunit 5 [Luteuthis dentatus]WAP91494.1 NADH dehydrogenase subunit 5 [Luteuthis dentatus]